MKKIAALLALILLLLPAMSVSAADEVLTKEQAPLKSYESDQTQIEITQHTWTYKKHQLVFYVCHVTITDPAQLQSAFARDQYHRSYGEDTLSMAERNGAIFAINGDYYNHQNKIGIVLRNGEIFRDKSSSRDLLMVDDTGVMSVILKADRKDVTAQALLDGGAQQVYEFGPALVDGGAVLTLPEKYFISMDEDIREPRTAIGWVSDLHYVFVVADGRRKNWSEKGMNLQELADIMQGEGCTVAYNLDGGGSSTLYFDGEVINNPSGGRQRDVSDIILIKP